jgi:hypothetical protein
VAWLTASAPRTPYPGRQGRTHHDDGWRFKMVGGILSAVFQLLGDIFGFVGAILNAIF